MDRKFTPIVGELYQNRNGWNYRCEHVLPNGCAVMSRESDGWTFTAHGFTQYSDGKIEWDYSTDGHWEGGEL